MYFLSSYTMNDVPSDISLNESIPQNTPIKLRELTKSSSFFENEMQYQTRYFLFEQNQWLSQHHKWTYFQRMSILNNNTIQYEKRSFLK